MDRNDFFRIFAPNQNLNNLWLLQKYYPEYTTSASMTAPRPVSNRCGRFLTAFPTTHTWSSTKKYALIDTVEVSFGEQFIDNIRAILKDRPIDYLVVDHMEPDHSSSIKTLRLLYPEMQIVGNAKTLQMLDGYYGIHTLTREVKEGESISLGQKNLSFYMAPMVHWPEVMVTYCPEHKVLFSADAFGTFGALNGGILDSSFRWTISGTRCAATTPASWANTAPPYRKPSKN